MILTLKSYCKIYDLEVDRPWIWEMIVKWIISEEYVAKFKSVFRFELYHGHHTLKKGAVFTCGSTKFEVNKMYSANGIVCVIGQTIDSFPENKEFIMYNNFIDVVA